MTLLPCPDCGADPINHCTIHVSWGWEPHDKNQASATCHKCGYVVAVTTSGDPKSKERAEKFFEWPEGKKPMAVTYVSAMVFAETVAREQREAGLREAAGIASQSGATLGSIVADAILAAIPSPPNIGEGEQPWLKDRPTESGWYWVRTCHGDEEVVLVKGDTETCPLYVLEHGRAERHPLKDYADACEWKPIKFKE